MAAKGPHECAFDQQELNIFQVITSGDANLVAKCVYGSCDINELGDDGLTPLCAAIRNGESDIACFLIHHARLFRKEHRSDDSSACSLFCTLLSDARWHRFTSNKIGNLLLNRIWKTIGFLAIHFTLNILLPRFDVWFMSVFHLKNFMTYSILRTNVLQRQMCSFVRLLVDIKSRQDEMPLSTNHRGTNLTAQGYLVVDRILKYGGDIEPIMLEMLREGLVFDSMVDGNDFNSEYALSIWEWAAIKGHVKIMVALQGMGMSLDAGSGLALRIACFESNADLCKYLLHSGASVNSPTAVYREGVRYSRDYHKNPAIVQCARGIVSKRGRGYESSLARMKALSIMKALVEYGEGINQTTQKGETALSIVCSGPYFQEIATFLLDNGALPNIADESGNTALHKASHAIEAPSITRMLLKAGATPNVFDKHGKTPMDHAASDGDSVLNLDLLLNASDPACVDWDILLYRASQFGCLEMLEYLLGKGANPTVEVEEDDCALFAAMRRRFNSEEATLLLLSHEASGSFVTKSGKTVLHQLVKNFRASALCDPISRFIECGADIEAVRECDP